MLERRRGCVVRGRATICVKGSLEFEVWEWLVGRRWSVEPRSWWSYWKGRSQVAGDSEQSRKDEQVGGANGRREISQSRKLQTVSGEFVFE